MTNFSQLGLSDPILTALSELGFETPSQIQAEAIPLLISRDIDFIGLAQTGTGKTAAFGLPLLDKVNPNLKHTQALILAPTRELGQQIGTQLKAFGKHLKGLKLETVYGGAPIMGQIRSIKEKSPHIIIATPGRLMDLMKRKVIDVSKIDTLVLDEADEMLNMGFKEDIDTILSYTSGESTTWLFSATMPPEIRHIIKNYMVNPQEVRVAPNTFVNENISHHYYLINREDKTEAIVRLLDAEPDMLGIIFCRTKADTQMLADELSARGYAVEALHGDLNQGQRDRVMRKFKAHEIRLITATDVAARGIDVKNISHVIHHSLPDDVEYYTHRSGRTARAGEKGVSVSLATRGDLRKINQFDKKLKLGMQKATMPSALDISQQRLSSWVAQVKSVTELPEQAVTHEVEAQLSSLTKTELIERLVALELASITHKNIEIKEPEHSDGDFYSDRPNRKRNRGYGGKKSAGGSSGGGSQFSKSSGSRQKPKSNKGKKTSNRSFSRRKR